MQFCHLTHIYFHFCFLPRTKTSPVGMNDFLAVLEVAYLTAQFFLGCTVIFFTTKFLTIIPVQEPAFFVQH